MVNNTNLVKLIAEKNLLNPGITIRFKVKTSGFGGVSVLSERDSVLSSVDKTSISSRINGRVYKVNFEDVLAIDGMSVERFAQAYRIKTKKR